MPVSEAQKKATREYLKGLDEIRIRAKKGTKARWKAAAEARGQSLNQFIVETVDAEAETPVKAPESPTDGVFPSRGCPITEEARKAATEAAEATGEELPQFVERAVLSEALRDKRSWSMGINPATGKKAGE